MDVPRCHICQADVQDTELRVHLRSAWHIYNLKRSIASLAPLSEAQFLKKQELLGSIGASGPDSILQDKEKLHCESCRKSFNSNKSYENHVRSRQHMAKLRESERIHEKSCEMNMKNSEIERVDDTDVETISGEENFGEPLLVGACLFCSLSFAGSPKPESRVLCHMMEAHNFVLPFSDKLVDAHGLLTELGRLVGEEFACLGCGRKFLGRRNNRHKCSLLQLRREALKAVRMHMIDKEHNFLYIGKEDPVVVALAVAETAEDGEIGRPLPPIARVGGELYSQFYAPDKANRTVVLPDNADEGEEIYEVHLPTGGFMGHRRYYQTVYRQNVGSYLCEAAKRRKQLALAMGAEGTGGRRLSALETTRCGDLANCSYGGSGVLRTEALPQMLNKIELSKYDLKLGLRGNRVLRGHFRRQY
ncbi:hypothetical protein TSMEX_000473 [Taenia solium]|eukprot:TsM_000062400 transcript=TsM_000062400 gene=TsM_000062400